jgi:hypothetical protein
MKTSNYLIALAALTSFTFVSCSDNDFIGTGSGPGLAKGNGEISFNAGGGKITRGEEITGKDAADKLDGKFTVYGWKTNSTASGSADGVHEDVFKDYLLTWGANTAFTTESNTNNWEYVGNTSQPINGAGVDQTIKYWDYSTNRYDFIAWTINDGSAAVLKDRATVTSTSVKPSLTFNAPTAKSLGSVYISDKYTATPEGTTIANLTNASSTKHTFGKYMGKDATDDASKDAVRLQFRSLAAKVRIGLYETVPGYQVSDVVFYKENADKAWNYTYTGEDATDYPSNQTYATLFADANTFTRSGDLTVYYHDATYMTGDAKLDNTAYTDLAPITQSKYFAFGQLTNTKGAGTKTVIAANEAIGTTSNTATMSIGNDENTLYTYVFPMEKNTNALNLKVNYKLTSTDGSGETILVSGANAVVPANFAQWMANYAYTYLFKISDNTNGSTNPTGPEGLYPITFDAVVVDAQEGYQETITTVNDNSITTYQNGSEVTVNDEYLSAKGDIYVAIKGTPDLTAGTNIKLYICEDQDAKETLSEEVAANYLNNGMIFTNVSDLLTVNAAAIEVPNSSGAGHGINFAANKVAKFNPTANTIYVVEYDAGGGVKSYKIIKVDDATATQDYTVAMAASLTPATNETAAFTIKNGERNVTGAKSLVVVKKGTSVVTDQFEIAETSEGNYTVTPKTAVAGTDYKVYFNGEDAGNTFTVVAPVWTPAKVFVEEGKSVTSVLTNKTGTGAAAIAGVTPTAPTGLKASKTTSTGQTTITAAAGEFGEKIVSYNGSNLTVEVDKFTLTLDHSGIINVGDADHNTATLTMANANGSGTSVASKAIASSDAEVAAGGSIGTTTMTVTALKAGKTTLSATGTNAKVNLEVVDYKLTADGVNITLKKDNSEISGQVFSAPSGVTVTATSATGVYKVSGTAGTHTIQFKYKGQVVADVDVTIPAP